MSYELSDTERNAALQLNADYRFDHFISKLVEHEELFVLTDEHGVMMLTTEEEDCIPVWPHPDYAKAWAEGEEGIGPSASRSPSPSRCGWIAGWTAWSRMISAWPCSRRRIRKALCWTRPTSPTPLRKSRPNAAECPSAWCHPGCNKDPANVRGLLF